MKADRPSGQDASSARWRKGAGSLGARARRRSGGANDSPKKKSLILLGVSSKVVHVTPSTFVFHVFSRRSSLRRMLVECVCSVHTSICVCALSLFLLHLMETFSHGFPSCVL